MCTLWAAFRWDTDEGLLSSLDARMRQAAGCTDSVRKLAALAVELVSAVSDQRIFTDAWHLPEVKGAYRLGRRRASRATVPAPAVLESDCSKRARKRQWQSSEPEQVAQHPPSQARATPEESRTVATTGVDGVALAEGSAEAAAVVTESDAAAEVMTDSTDQCYTSSSPPMTAKPEAVEPGQGPSNVQQAEVGSAVPTGTIALPVEHRAVEPSTQGQPQK